MTPRALWSRVVRSWLERQQYRVRRGFRLYVKPTDILEAVATFLLLVIAVNGLSQYPTVTLVAAAVYLPSAFARYIFLLRDRRARNATERKLICQLFMWFYEELFDTTPGRRITLFEIDPLRPEFVVPKVRYEPGHARHFAEHHSRARYRAGEGFTGRAWNNLEELMIELLGPFSNRAEFRTHYLEVLKIPEETVDRISDYMIAVQAIYSYGFRDHEGHLLGIVSIDIQGPPDNAAKPAANQIKRMLKALGGVLEAFSYERRRP